MNDVKHDGIPGDLPPLSERVIAHASRRRRLEAKFFRKDAHHEWDQISRLEGFLVLVLNAGLRCLGLHGRGARNTLDLRLCSEDLPVPDLPPALDGLRLLHLSDLHLGRTLPEHMEAVCRLLEGLSADLCVITGDLRFGHFGPFDHVAPAVRRMLDGMQLRYGAYTVLGNHDSLALAESVEEAGLRVLLNEGVAIAVNGAVVWLAGVDDPHNYRLDDLDAALHGAPPDAFPILLAHSPECADEAAAKGVRLYLCGHTHGGQIRVPYWGPLYFNARCPRDRGLGHWQAGAMVGHTSTGLGNTNAVVRFGCPPEATLLTLRRG